MKYLKTYEERFYWGRCATGILAISQSTKRILLALRSSEVLEPGTWNLVSGKLDEGEEDENIYSHIEGAAHREFDEETGYKGEIKLIPAYVFRTPNKIFEFHNFIGIIDNEFEPELNWETEYFKWVTFDELMKIKPKHFGLQKLLKDKKSLDIIKRYAI